MAHLKTDNHNVNIAYYTAISDVAANIKPIVDGAESNKPVLIAGIGYTAPWTRDTAINVKNAGYLFPEVARDTLMAVTKKEDGVLVADGSYGQDWDSVIWVIGAYNLYLYNGDIGYLKKVYKISEDSLTYYEKKAYNKALGLYKGPAVYGDGIAAYPDRYVFEDKSGILSYAGEGKSGTSIDMYCLSTNCVYYKVLLTVDKMAEALGLPKKYEAKADLLKENINNRFWNDNKGYYSYILDDFGGCDYFEGMGNSFAILYDIADHSKKTSIFLNHPSDKCGMPCVYPSFDRYTDGGEYGRHSGTVWPHIQSFWADCAAKNGQYKLFDKEFNMLTKCAVRDGYFAEIYHPDTSLTYGGRQEDNNGGMKIWDSEKKQTWSATGYLNMIFSDIIGMNFMPNGVEFTPYLPKGIEELRLTDFVLRNTSFDITIKGNGNKVKSFTVNGEKTDSFAAYDGTNKIIEIEVG